MLLSSLAFARFSLFHTTFFLAICAGFAKNRGLMKEDLDRGKQVAFSLPVHIFSTIISTGHLHTLDA